MKGVYFLVPEGFVSPEPEGPPQFGVVVVQVGSRKFNVGNLKPATYFLGSAGF